MNLNFLRGPGNVSLDLMRVGGFSAFITYPFPFIYDCIKNGHVPDPSSWGIGYATVIGAIGTAILAKDYGVAKATSITNAPN